MKLPKDFKETERVDGHIWGIWHGLESCALCGFVRRADRKNKPCRGVIKIELRASVPD